MEPKMCTADAPRRGVLVCQPVHQHAYETALAAQDSGYLRYFATGLYDKARGLTDPRLRAKLPGEPLRNRIERELRRRRHPELDPDRVLALPRYHAVATGFRRSVGWLPRLRRVDLDTWAHHRFDRRVGRMLPQLSGVDLVHAFEGTALATLQAAKRAGKKTVLDVPSAHEYFALAEGTNCQPRIALERQLADTLLAPSDYVVSCLTEAGVPQDRIVKVPYGVDAAAFKPGPAPQADREFRAVFIGTIGRRKGVSYLLEAWRRLALPHAELILVGYVDEEGRRLLGRYRGVYRFVGSCPKHEIHRFLRQSDVFVFPSLAEGSALVTYEALASGLPVITTPNSGSVVRDGIDGFLVPPRDVDAIGERLELLYGDPALRGRMAAQGRALIERSYTWRHYRERVAGVYRGMLDGDGERRATGSGAHP